LIEPDGSIKAQIEKKYFKNLEEYDTQPEKKKAAAVPKTITILTKKKSVPNFGFNTTDVYSKLSRSKTMMKKGSSLQLEGFSNAVENLSPELHARKSLEPLPSNRESIKTTSLGSGMVQIRVFQG